jgi:hypothetical protein
MTLPRVTLGTGMMLLVCLHSAAAQDIDTKRQRAAYCLGYVISAKAYFSTNAAALQDLDNLQHRLAIYLSFTGGFGDSTTNVMILGKLATERCFGEIRQSCLQRCQSAATPFRCADECFTSCRKIASDCGGFDPLAPP